jgi:dye decolorizing peroxidase
MLLGGAVAGAGVAALTACTARGDETSDAEAAEAARLQIGSDVVPFHGAHQPGVTAEPQAHATLVALTLRKSADRDAIRRLLQVLTDDAARLTQGRGALADTEPELAQTPARLTVTFGFGPELVRRVAGDSAVPSWLRPLRRSASTGSRTGGTTGTCCCRSPPTTP